MPTCRTARKRWALAAAALALLFPSPGRSVGPTTVVESVVYQGAKHIKEAELNALTGVRKGEPVNPAKNKSACQKIMARLRETGRLFATCDLLAGGQVTDTRVVFNITEGPKVKIADIELIGSGFGSAALLKASLKSAEFRPGLEPVAAPYDPAAVEKAIRDLEEVGRSLGYQEVRVSRELRWAPDGRSVVLLLHIELGPRSRPTKPVGTEPADAPVPLFNR